MQIWSYRDSDFTEKIQTLNRFAVPPAGVASVVEQILGEVKAEGDKALYRLTEKFDLANLRNSGLRVSVDEIQAATKSLSSDLKKAIATAHSNVRKFSQKTIRKSWFTRNAQGARVGEVFHPFQRVGIYVPGGTAPLASTAIMTVTLAKTAGCPEIVVTTPPRADGSLNPALLHALHYAGATEIYKVGGAQAIGALAYGTSSIGRVNKIYGPGNAFIIEAKRQCVGVVAIDQLPGPSEIALIADRTGNPEFIAADMLAQAEHGGGNQILFLTDREELTRQVQMAIECQFAALSRKGLIEKALAEGTWLVTVSSLKQAVDIVNAFAPEHLTLICKKANTLLKQITSAGAVFIGNYSPVVAGDFLAGPSHELPTGGAGKSFSGLTLDQFYKRTSVVEYDARSLKKSLKTIQTFSELEGLDAHGRSAQIRFS